MTATCKHPGCDRPSYRIGYCTAHRSRFMRGRDMDAPLRGTVPVETLFWQKVAKGPDCWEWTAAKNADGYGSFWHNGAMVGAHRLSYAWEHGPIPDGMQVDHTCLNPPCVNPSHMRLATYLINGQNRKGAYSNSASGVRGVHWDRATSKWVAAARVNYRHVQIGRFRKKDEAVEAVTKWRRENMPYSEMDKRKEPA